MTDRQIVAVFFPDLLSDEDTPQSYHDVFRSMGKRLKLTDRQIADAWERRYG
jgi:hypothetical protein